MNWREAVDTFYYSKGELYWKNGRRAGTVSHTNKGLRFVRYQGKSYLEHRIIFLIVNGYLPEYVFHKDGDVNNNDHRNLMGTDEFAVVRQRQKLNTRNTSGYKGVSHSVDGRYRASIGSGSSREYLGIYDTPVLAAKAYDRRARQLNKEGCAYTTNKELGLL